MALGPMGISNIISVQKQFPASPKVFLLVRICVKDHRSVDALPLGEHADRLVDPDLIELRLNMRIAKTMCTSPEV